AALFWWCPVVWLARAGLRAAEEECCDAWVVWALPGLERQYAEALVDAADFLCESRSGAPALASGLGPVQHLRRRLTMIMREPTARRLPRPGLLAVLAAGLVALTVGVTGQAQQPPPREGGREERAERERAERADRDRAEDQMRAE